MARSQAAVPLLFALLSAGCGSSKAAPATTVDDAGPAVDSGGGSGAAFSLDEGTLTLKPGQEGLFCKQMAVPAEYATGDYFVTAIDADVSLGTHHLIVTASDEALATTAPLCKDTGSGQVLSGGASFQDFAVNPNPISVIESLKRVGFGGGGGIAKVRFPEGYGKPMPLGFFESSHHVVNLGEDPLEIHGRFDVYAAPGDQIVHPMGILFANALQINVQPQSEGQVETTFTVPEAIDLVAFTSHAHNFLTRFEMFLFQNGETAAEPVYLSEDYESPKVEVHDPPIHLAAGDGVTFRCTYRNDTAAKIGWGVVSGEMCMPFVMYAYPDGAPRKVPPTMSAAMSGSKPMMLAEGTAGFLGG